MGTKHQSVSSAAAHTIKEQPLSSVSPDAFSVLTSPNGYTLWDESLSCILCNDAVCSLFALSGKDSYLENPFRFFPHFQPGGQESKKAFLECLHQAFHSKSITSEWLQQTLNGEPVPTKLTFSRVEHAGQAYVSVIICDLRGLSWLAEDMQLGTKGISGADAILQDVNRIAQVLLSSNGDDFASCIQSSLGILAYSARVDRVRFWRCRRESFDAPMLWYDWVNESAVKNDALPQCCYEQLLPEEKEKLMGGQCVGLSVSALSGENARYLCEINAQSILVAPILTEGDLWGLITLIDCHRDRKWLTVEEFAVQAVGRLVEAAVRQYSTLQELKNAKAEAEKATRAKSSYLARMSHEVRTPLNAILGMCYLTLQTNLSTEQRSNLLKMQVASQKLLSIINDILDFAKVEAGKMVLENVPFSLEDTLNGLSDMLLVKAEEKGLLIHITKDDTIPDHLVGDPLRISQILLNLASNAVKFTEKGEVGITVSCVQKEKESIHLRFSVQDTGIGINPEQMGFLFSPFFQTDGSIPRRFGGSGLGLAICKQLVELMGGEIQVESLLGHGSTFAFTLSLGIADEVSEEVEEITEKQEIPAHLSGKYILLVEDNDINQEIAKAILEQAGIVVDAVGTGMEAVEAVKRNKYDLVLMDVQMPVMDGIEATKCIRMLPSVPVTLPIIAMTAHAMELDRTRSLAAGMNDYVTKPVDPIFLFQTLGRWIKH